MVDQFRTIASNSTNERRIINVGSQQSKLINNRLINPGHNTGFDQNFDSQNLPQRSQTHGPKSNLGGNLLKVQSTDRLTTADAIEEESYTKSMPKKNFGNQSSQQNLNGGRSFIRDLAESSKLEESVAALDRPPRRIEGLTQFLREEYFRKVSNLNEILNRIGRNIHQQSK